MKEDRLRELYQQALERRRPAERPDCIAPDQLLALAEGRLAEQDALAAADHAMACAHCHDEYKLLRSIVQSRGNDGLPAARKFALAASVVIVISASALWLAVRQRDAGSVRGTPVAVELVRPDARAGQPLTLTWRGVPGTSRYEVELLDSASALLHQATTRDTSIVVPLTIRLAQGAAHRWWVRALLPDGRELRSAIDTFRVR